MFGRDDTLAGMTSVLEREMYSEAEAARLLRVPQATLNYWLEGSDRRGKRYEPIIRPTRKGGRAPVTWAEFVEAGLLREYRRAEQVPMAELRAFIDKLRERYNIPYPLADRRPYVAGKELVVELQDEVGLDAEFCMVAVVRDQPLLTFPAQSFFQRVTWDDDTAVAWRPHDDPSSPVLIDPGMRFGRPAVGGISTEVIWEHVNGGEDEHYVAEAFDLPLADVRWAMAYESGVRAA